MDDLGYGNVGSYESIGLQTSNMESLANGGLRFTNGYASSATCTASRFAILTGTYPWRNKDAHILQGTAPLLIATGQQTVANMLRNEGYPCIVGKYHLGLGYGNIGWNKNTSPSPNEVGFNYSFITAATQDRLPIVYLEDGHVVNPDPEDPMELSYEHNLQGEPTALDHSAMVQMKWSHGHNKSIVNGIPRIGFIKGGNVAEWQDTTMANTFLARRQHYVKGHKDAPLFLYYAPNEPHFLKAAPTCPPSLLEGKD